MLTSKDFDVTNPTVVVRLMAGLFYVPHIVFKLAGFAGSQAAFAKMGFEPPLFWVSLAIMTETLCAIGLTLGKIPLFCKPGIQIGKARTFPLPLLGRAGEVIE